MTTISEDILKAHLRSIQKRDLDGRIFAFHVENRSAFEASESLRIQNTDWRIEKASSELAIREILLEAEGHGSNPGTHTAVLTPLDHDDIMSDVTSRLTGQRLWRFDPWQAIRSLFGVGGVDDALRQSSAGRKLADLLLRAYGGRGDINVAGDRLSRDIAWRKFQEGILQQRPPANDLIGWLAWGASSPQKLSHLLRQIDNDVCDALADRLGRRFGTAGDLLLPMWKHFAEYSVGNSSTLAKSRSTNFTSAGLWSIAAGLIIHATNEVRDDEQSAKYYSLRGSLTSKFIPDDYSVDLDDNHLWAHASEFGDACHDLISTDVVDLDSDTRRKLGSVIDNLFNRLSKSAIEFGSSIPLGETTWNNRLNKLGDRIDSALNLVQDSRSEYFDIHQVGQHLNRLDTALDQLAQHDFAHRRRHRFRTVRAAAKLTAWLLSDSRSAESLDRPHRHDKLAEKYIKSDAFADLERQRLHSGDAPEPLRKVISELTELADTLSDQANDHFSASFSESISEPVGSSSPVNVQDFVSQKLAPVAQRHPTCVIVLDGLSWSIALKLLNDEPFASRWQTWAPAEGTSEGASLSPMFATVPSETEYSRTALLTGRLRAGSQHEESKGFARALVDAGAVGRTDQCSLFHKAKLDSDPTSPVGGEVRRALNGGNSDRDQRDDIVGVVVNTIDDSLSGSDQHNIDWTVADIGPLETLLESAANRAVFIVSDHGHVWDGSDYRSGGTGAARWRSADEPPGDGERRVAGPMIEQLTGESEIVAPYKESIRYSQNPKRGEHGGIARQEVISPAVVVTHNSLGPDLSDHASDINLTQFSPEPPAWWHFEAEPETPDLHLRTKESLANDQPNNTGPTQTSLLAEDSDIPTDNYDFSWLHEFLANDRFKRRREQHAPDISRETFAKLLAYLYSNDNRLDLSTAARLLQTTSSQLRFQLSPIRQTLNVEGYPALEHNRTEQSIHLDIQTLRRQFGL